MASGEPAFCSGDTTTTHPRVAELEALLATSESTLVATRQALERVTAERDKLRRAYEQLQEQLELLRRRIFVAKAERVDVAQLEMEFAQTHEKLAALAKQLDESDTLSSPPESPPPESPPPKSRPKPTGRRDLADEAIPVERVEILNPALEGKVERIGFEQSSRMAYRRGGPVRVVVARATYKPSSPVDVPADAPASTPEGPAAVDPPSLPSHAARAVPPSSPVPLDAAAEADNDEPVSVLVTAAKPKELIERGILAPTMIAHILVDKYRWGLPFHRQSRMLAAQGARLDDSTMCRYAEDVGATLGCIVEACVKEAKETAFCLSTDATGVCIQPEPAANRQRQACRKGHFFVVLADQDHVFFEFQPKHTSAAVCEMFRGFSGYIQADAHAIYDAVFRGEARVRPDDPLPREVGCWAHCRRKAWEAAVITKDPAAREALLRMRALFELDAQWRPLPPAQRHARRQLVSRRLVDDFFAWADEQYARVKDTRGLVATAFGYAVRQEAALRRFLDDGRLPMTNNHSERAVRPIAVGRKSWLFFGSNDHASAAANLFSLIASCELHRLDPELYLAEIVHVLPYWPRDRYLELAPKYWAATRARLIPRELAVEIGDITVPPPLPAQQQASSR
jgi:transposase